jgi:hypothetical protein
MATRVKCPECGMIFKAPKPKSRIPRHHPKGIPIDKFPEWREVWCLYSGKPGIPEAEWEEVEEIEAGGE